MQGSKKNNLCSIWFCLLLSLYTQISCATEPEVAIKHATLKLHTDQYLLIAEVAYKLGNVAEKALQSGIPLFWDVQFVLLRERPIIWDQTLFNETLRYRIRYHPLLNLYEVTDYKHNKVQTYTRLATVLELLGQIRVKLKISSGKNLSEDGLIAGLKVQFDREALPIPLRPLAYFKSNWDLSSSWYYWPLLQQSLR